MTLPKLSTMHKLFAGSCVLCALHLPGLAIGQTRNDPATGVYCVKPGTTSLGEAADNCASSAATFTQVQACSTRLPNGVVGLITVILWYEDKVRDLGQGSCGRTPASLNEVRFAIEAKISADKSQAFISRAAELLAGATGRSNFAKAFDAWKSGNLAEAEHLTREGLKIDPRDYRAHAMLADVLRNLGRPNEARSSYKQVMLLAPLESAEHSAARAQFAAEGNVPAAERPALRAGADIVLQVLSRGATLPSMVEKTIQDVTPAGYSVKLKVMHPYWKQPSESLVRVDFQNQSVASPLDLGVIRFPLTHASTWPIRSTKFSTAGIAMVRNEGRCLALGGITFKVAEGSKSGFEITCDIKQVDLHKETATSYQATCMYAPGEPDCSVAIDPFNVGNMLRFSP